MKRSLSKCRAVVGALVAGGALAVGLNTNADPVIPNGTQAMPAMQPGQPNDLPYGVADVVGMWRSGAKSGDLISYVRGTAVPYQLTADQLVQLRTMGLPNEVIEAIIQRGAQLRQEKQVPPPPPSVILAYSGAIGDEPYVAEPYYGYDYPFYAYPFDGWPYYVGPFVGGYYGYGYGFHGYHGYAHPYGYHGGHFGGGGFHGGFGGGAMRGGGGFHGGGGGGRR